jgi:DNA invertase Pin-like site-specific DNA recombinase
LKTALYLRVSTRDQNLENQRLELTSVALSRGWQIVETYTDTISGSTRRDKRPGMREMLDDAKRGKFKLVAAWSIDRLGRSVQDLLQFLEELQAVGVELYTHKQAFDTTTPAGRMMFSMLGVIAEFERGILIERTYAGLARAKANGKRIGRPPLSPERRAEVLQLAGEGLSRNHIAKRTKLAWSCVDRVIKGSWLG